MAAIFKNRTLPEKYKILGFIFPLLLLAAWQALTYNKRTLTGPPEDTALELWKIIADGTVFKLLAVSMTRVVEGFLAGTFIGLAVGIIMGSSKTGEKIIAASFHGLRQVPMVAWVPLIMMWFGKGGMAQVVFIAWSALYPMALNTYDGIRGIPVKYLEVGRVFEYSRRQMITNIIIPAALPSIKTGTILSLNMAWTLLVAAEIMTSEPSGGLGDLLSEGRETFNMPMLISGMLIMGCVGFILNQTAEYLWGLALKNRTDITKQEGA
jgi:sulfonate transport system permease protein